MDSDPTEVVLDTKRVRRGRVNPGSHSARLVEAVRDWRLLRMVWDDANHAEIDQVIHQIPRFVMESYRGPVPLGGPVRRFDGS